jgi:hypothetical protein
MRMKAVTPTPMRAALSSTPGAGILVGVEVGVKLGVEEDDGVLDGVGVLERTVV